MDPRQRCGCTHGQRCICALKKEHPLDTVPETGLPPSRPPVSEPKKPQLTSTKSESTLTTFRDGHHKPPHKHNDMAHKCGLPYTIPRSHTIHSTSDARRSMDHLPMARAAWEDLSQRRRGQSLGGSQRLVKSEHGSPESAPVNNAEDVTTSVPPLDLSSFFPSAAPAQSSDSNDGSAGATMPTTFDENPLDQAVTSVPPLDVSFPSFQTSNTSPIARMAFQDPYDSYFASPDTDLSLGSAALSAPPVDWSSFPLYSDVPAATSTQTPSYASFDYSAPHGLPAPSSSGDLSEIDEFAPLTSCGNTDLPELPSLSESSEVDQFRISSASSFIGLPQTQLLASNHLESIDIDDFLKSANESTAALEHQLQASMGIEQKSLPAQHSYSNPQGQDFQATTATTDPIWPSNMFDTNSTMDGNYYPQSWSQ